MVEQMRHTSAVRSPTWRERLHFKLFGLWPDGYVAARLAALASDELEFRAGLQKSPWD